MFINLRKALRQRCWLARKGQSGSDRLVEWCLDAFDLLTEPTFGTQREVWKAVAQDPTLRRSLSANMSNMSEDARVRSYLDTRRRHVPTQNIAGEQSSGESLRIQMTSRLVQDPKLFAGATGVLFRAPDRIKAEELLSGMRWITDLSSNALVPGAHALTASDVHDFISRWDSANFVHAAEGKIWALDFSVYLRFDAFALNPEESTTSSGKCIKPLSLDVKWKKLVNPPHAFSQEAIRKRNEAWHFARHATRQREAIVLLAALRDEYASSLARNSVATTALDRDLQFKAKLYLGRQSIVGQISPLPGLAMYLAAMESDSDRGLVTLAEARLALAQCGVFLTASETFLLGLGFRVNIIVLNTPVAVLKKSKSVVALMSKTQARYRSLASSMRRVLLGAVHHRFLDKRGSIHCLMLFQHHRPQRHLRTKKDSSVGNHCCEDVLLCMHY